MTKEKTVDVKEQEVLAFLKEKQDAQKRQTPNSDLDFNFQVTENTWGKEGSITPELKRRLIKIKGVEVDKEGKLQNISYESLWDALGYFTRDLRLSNLDERTYKEVVHYLNLAGDYLSVNFNQAFIICLSRVASIVETSQSKKGFLRTILNSIFQHNKYEGLEPEKRSMLTGKSKNGGNN